MLSEAKHLFIDFNGVLIFFATLSMTIYRSPLNLFCPPT